MTFEHFDSDVARLDALRAIAAFADRTLSADETRQVIDEIFKLYEGREGGLASGTLNAAVVLMQQMVPDVRAEMIAKARSWTLEKIDVLKIDASAEPVLEDYRACLEGLKAIEVFVSEDHSQTEAQRIVDEIFIRYYQEDRYHELAEGVIDAVAVLMMQITPDVETKIITVIRSWFLEDIDKGLGD
jgi:hypothetical protein